MEAGSTERRLIADEFSQKRFVQWRNLPKKERVEDFSGLDHFAKSESLICREVGNLRSDLYRGEAGGHRLQLCFIGNRRLDRERGGARHPEHCEERKEDLHE